MKYWVLLFFFWGFLITCGCNRTPKGVIRREELVSLLVDIHLVEGYIFSLSQDSIILKQQHESVVKKLNTHVVKKQEADRLKKQQDSLQREIKQLDSSQQRARLLYDMVYKKHHTNKMEFDQSLHYYSKRPGLLDSIYGGVSNDLEKRRKREEMHKLNEGKKR